jgi:probable HAF family extracellular repeat protein
MKLSISKTQLSRIARAGLALAVLAGMVWAQEQSVPQKRGAVRYIITDLGTLGGPFSEALDVNNNGLVSGVATLTDGTEHAFLWQKGVITDQLDPPPPLSQTFAGSGPTSSVCLSCGKTA